jgi:hypothetical protein
MTHAENLSKTIDQIKLLEATEQGVYTVREIWTHDMEQMKFHEEGFEDFFDEKMRYWPLYDDQIKTNDLGFFGGRCETFWNYCRLPLDKIARQWVIKHVGK